MGIHIGDRETLQGTQEKPDKDNYRDSGLDETESRMTTLGGAWAGREDGDAKSGEKML